MADSREGAQPIVSPDVILSSPSANGVTRRLRRLYCTLALLFILVGAVRIISTYRVFNQTFDEPKHIASGLEWWERGTYTIDSQQPPLARVAATLGPYLAGVRSRGRTLEERIAEGTSELNTNNAYWSNLALARIGILPFYLLACAVVWFWTERVAGGRAALMAILLFTSLPAVLGHSGLATTDMAVTASLCASLLCFVLWLEDPTPRRTWLFGITLGVAVLSKFSTFVFFPACIAVLVVGRASVMRHNAKLLPGGFAQRFRSVLACLAIASLVVWAGYRFELTPLIAADGSRALSDQQHLEHALGRHPALLRIAQTIGRTPLPGMMVVRGVLSVQNDNAEGCSANFFGQWSRKGWWYFFPVLLVFKTPLAFLILVLVGLVLMFRQSRMSGSTMLSVAPAFFMAAIIGVSLFARINIGIRHILPVYPLLAIVAACAVEAMFAQYKSAALKVVACGLIAWLVISSALAHPDYLAYFNELIPDRPERIIVESDLDWGQDLQRLSNRLRERGVPGLSLAYFGTADVRKFNLPQFRELPPYEKVEGWVAISVHNLELPADALISYDPSGVTYSSIPVGLAGSVRAEGGPFSWLKSYSPIERVGRSILLYYIRPANQKRDSRW
jgi:hypothetical protein